MHRTIVKTLQNRLCLLQLCLVRMLQFYDQTAVYELIWTILIHELNKD
jgi:hypothetical protein